MLILAVVASAVATGACSNMPGWADVKLPSAGTFLPTSANSFNQAAINSSKPVRAADLVDAQGFCAGGAGATASEGESGTNLNAVALDMTECQVVRALGVPQATDITRNARGERTVTLTYLGTERAGLYRFVRGRLVSIERAPGAEPERPANNRNRRSSSRPDTAPAAGLLPAIPA
ncbi:MAG: hypothetical protein WAU53_10280 [Rhodoplanes sp.]